jgi:hypothetical protein
MLVNLPQHVKRTPVPHEPGEWLDLRRLTFGEMKELHEGSLRSYFDDLAELPQPVIEAQLKLEKDAQKKRASAKVKAKPPAEQGDPLAGLNLEMILQFGVMAWSYVDGDGAPVEVTPLTIAALDEVTADWAARAIMLMDAQKDDDGPLGGSSPSTDTSTA